MSTFSLDLIEKDFVHYWLMSKNSSLAPSTFIDISNGFRAKFESENLNINLDFLVCPQAVVNNIVLGQVFGDPYYFALPETLSQTVHPTSRRFVFDMEQSEFLEVSFLESFFNNPTYSISLSACVCGVVSLVYQPKHVIDHLA
ncbi:uncharacterized protein Gasu_54590 [Galdieria sulphuraria]|uniref:Uncharacterized protein n=1 Tax=Galdieria sulphuraria TaxID=130081 RepID=M2XU02_GALSU|nr:uncharacterized protein Gasu_54590 [Galdieria sulphuraria]EME26884.1 hypothetical protein Gasu_54590 [Galdieria sulphuraria]|eukprot:XP_005703404.1 hypothetical protein Gasu_54590 [Galdieria sulphuraria]